MAELNFGRIGVLMGGPSTERDISLKSGEAVCGSLKQLGLKAVAIEVTGDDIEENIRLIKSHKINCAFVALHGRFGEDGQIQEILDTLKVPYTGSGVSASRLAMDKVASRQIFVANGLRAPKYKILCKSSYSRKHKIDTSDLGLPLVIKPACQGSSIGLSIVDSIDDLDRALDSAFSLDDRVLIEEYIKGREMTVGILDDRALPVIEIIPKRRFFDYEAKYKVGVTDYVVPAKLEKGIAKNLQEAALSAHRLLGCFGCCRVDMILGQNNVAYVLEVNTIPGMTKISLLPKAAKVAGIEFSQLCLKLIELAYEKTEAKAVV